MLGALAAMLPERAVGNLKGAGNNFLHRGRHPETGEPFLFYEFAAGGSGAVRGRGWQQWVPDLPRRRFRLDPAVEVAENECPLLIERSALAGWTGRARALAWRPRDRSSDPSAHRRRDALVPWRYKIQIPPFGVLGGESSGANAFGVIPTGRSSNPAPVQGR